MHNQLIKQQHDHMSHMCCDKSLSQLVHAVTVGSGASANSLMFHTRCVPVWCLPLLAVPPPSSGHPH